MEVYHAVRRPDPKHKDVQSKPERYRGSEQRTSLYQLLKLPAGPNRQRSPGPRGAASTRYQRPGSDLRAPAAGEGDQRVLQVRPPPEGQL